jgi:gamma-glutamyltranspeptidase/glutathione hydrolase
MTRAYKFDEAYRPTLAGSQYGVSTTHYLASHAAAQILDSGGNAIDAGVAAGLTLNVVESQMCTFAGVAPIMVYIATERTFYTIDGLGTWPAAASCEYFSSRGHKVVPEGILQTVVPGAPAAWLTALAKFGTMSFGEVATPAIRYARDGFPMYRLMNHTLTQKLSDFPKGSELARIYLPEGRPPRPGETFRQSDLGRTLQYLVDEERASASQGRTAAIDAVINAFYKGDIAQTIAQFHADNGGLLSRADLADYRVTVESPISKAFGDLDVISCGPWCQGPMLIQVLNIIESVGADQLKHNSAEYIHVVVEAIKLAAADRERYYGDPKFVDVPLAKLLSKEHARELAKQIATLEEPRAKKRYTGSVAADPALVAIESRPYDTSYAAVVDAQGNAFSATPSDGVIRKSPVVTGTGLIPSPRGLQSRIDPDHASSIASGKRPRLTPNPAMVKRDGDFLMPFGTPGGDLQVQAMTQVFLNTFRFGMSLQAAVEAPRFYSYDFPDTFAPHVYFPGVLRCEEGIDEETRDALRGRDHLVQDWPSNEWPRTGVCAVKGDTAESARWAAADCRRVCYGIVS